MILLDSNILAYAVSPNDPHHAACKRALDDAFRRPREFCVTWVNLFEYLRVVTHPKVLSTPLPFQQAFENLRELASRLTLIHPGDRHLEYVARVASDLAPVRGDLVSDCRIAAILLENGGTRMLSFDTKFRRVRGLQVDVPA